MKQSTVRIEGKNVHYYEWGTKNNPAIICFHGLGNSGASFSELAEHLNEHYHIISFDNPGHGKTSSFEKEEEYLFSNIANWYNRVLQLVISGPFYILGHSWGADIALHYAKQFPEKVKGIILLDGGYTFPDYQDDMTFSKVYEGWEHYLDHSSVFNTWTEVENEYKAYSKRWNETIEYMVSANFTKKNTYELISSKFSVLSIIKAFFKEGFTTTYEYIKSPLLLIHATLPIELEHAREKGINHLKQSISDVTIIPMDETGHMVQWDDPGFVADEIHKWIKKLIEAAV
ncbi:alpha/beta fold hydrolase [Peribacillus sp. SCS-37]|uniref:alpha/beta fold hydrolase n=1 Tax=Paraperibacillus esterisolvens TaxID=3115296 RepID=UPI003905C4A2